MGHTRRVLADVHLRFQCDDILVGQRVGVLAPTPTFSIVFFRARIDNLATTIGGFLCFVFQY
jgi:hypothetical protein